MNTLLICEKDNAAKRIASILSGNGHKSSKMGRVTVYDFDKDGESYTVVGLRGHVVNPDYPPEFNNWNKVNPRALIRAKPIKKITQKAIVDVLVKLGKEADRIVVATDYDREGELIGGEALEIVKHKNPEHLDIKRSRFSSLTPAEIKKAFDNLVEVDYNLSQAAESRQLIDLSWGAVLTRFISAASRQMGKDFLSVGRVQSPTLALIVDREKERLAFVPKPYWEIEGNCSKDDNEFPVKHKKDRFWKKEEALASWENVKEAREATLLEQTTEKAKEQRPAPFNTTSLQREATKISLSPSQTMNVAENLYNNGYISYPRTDNTVYPATLDFREILESLGTSSEFGDMAKGLLAKASLKPSRGKKLTTDHPPIHPVQFVPKSKLSPQEWRLYEMVVRRFLATLGEDAILERIKLLIDINTEPFVARGQRYLKMGWRAFYQYGLKKDSILPAFPQPDSPEATSEALGMKAANLEFTEKETQPPTRYGQAKLIQLMEERGLGTKSTRHTILTKLADRSYVENDPPVPTRIGYSVIDALERHAEVITKPDMTATLEADMDKISEGSKTLKEVVEESQDYLEKVMDMLEKHRGEIGKEIKDAIDKENEIGSCPLCNGPLIVKRSRYGKRFAGCGSYPDCRQTYPLPPYGKIVPQGIVCEHCQAPIVTVYNKRRSPWTICINLSCPSKKEQKKEEAKVKAEPKEVKAEPDKKELVAK